MFDNPMVKMASAIALVPLRVSADSLLVKEVSILHIDSHRNNEDNERDYHEHDDGNSIRLKPCDRYPSGKDRYE